MANRITSHNNSTAQPMSKMPAPLRRWPLPPPRQRAVPGRRPAKFHPFRLDWLERQKFLDSLQPYVADSQESSRKALRLTCLTLGRVVIDSDKKNAELESSKSYTSSKKLRSTWVPTIHKSNQWKKVRGENHLFCPQQTQQKKGRADRIPPSLRTSEGQEVVLRMRLGPMHHTFRTC